MKRRYWIGIVVLLALVCSTTVGWATTVYWRNNQYQLPGIYQRTVLQAILTDHKRDIDALIGSVQALTARVTSLEARMTTAEANIATNTANIATNAANIAANAANIAANQAAIALNASAIATNAANIANLQGRMTAAESSITNLQGRMTTAESSITNLQGRMTTAESNITSNTSAISSHVSNTTTAHSYDSRYVRDSGENLRTIRGSVATDGSIQYGTGFTVTKGGTGVYTVNYSTPFSAIATPVVSSSYRNVWNGGTVSTHYFTVNFVDSTDGSASDGHFKFVVMGRQ